MKQEIRELGSEETAEMTPEEYEADQQRRRTILAGLNRESAVAYPRPSGLADAQGVPRVAHR